MFKQKERGSGAPAGTGASGITMVGAADHIEGKVRASGDLHVDGTVEGDVKCGRKLTIGPDGKVRGEITSVDVWVAGELEGVIEVEGALHIHGSGVVRGEAVYGTLEVERGGVFSGRTTKSGMNSPALDAKDDDDDDDDGEDD